MKILIVDDELPARKKVRHFLEKMEIPSGKIDDVQDPFQALGMLRNMTYDLLYLDIQMPRLTGLELLQKLETGEGPAVIFSTAYDEYAIRAFELHAVDYLLKPYDFDRFKRATEYALERLDQIRNRDKVKDLLTHWTKSDPSPDTIWVSHGSKFIPVQIDNIEMIEASGNYVLLHVGQSKYAVKSSMTQMLKKVGRSQFVRVHKSFVVNTQFIKELLPKSHGDLIAAMKNGEKIAVSRTYRSDLL